MECKQPFGCRWGKTPKGGENGIPRLFSAISAFGKKLVGIANQFFERCLRQKVLRRKRQPLLTDFSGRQPGPRMPFADACIFLQIQMVRAAIRPQKLAANQPMPQIRLGTHAMDAWSVATENADIMQERRPFDSLRIEPVTPPTRLSNQPKGFVAYANAVSPQQSAKRGFLRIKRKKNRVHSPIPFQMRNPIGPAAPDPVRASRKTPLLQPAKSKRKCHSSCRWDSRSTRMQALKFRQRKWTPPPIRAAIFAENRRQ